MGSERREETTWLPLCFLGAASHRFTSVNIFLWFSVLVMIKKSSIVLSCFDGILLPQGFTVFVSMIFLYFGCCTWKVVCNCDFYCFRNRSFASTRRPEIKDECEHLSYMFDPSALTGMFVKLFWFWAWFYWHASRMVPIASIDGNVKAISGGLRQKKQHLRSFQCPYSGIQFMEVIPTLFNLWQLNNSQAPAYVVWLPKTGAYCLSLLVYIYIGLPEVKATVKCENHAAICF